MREPIGFHKDCGGRVYQVLKATSKNSPARMVRHCGRCHTYISEYATDDVTQEQQDFKRSFDKTGRGRGEDAPRQQKEKRNFI